MIIKRFWFWQNKFVKEVTHRVLGLDVDLICPDHAVLLVIRGRLPVDHHRAGVEGLGGHLQRLPGHWSEEKFWLVTKKIVYCPLKLGVKPSKFVTKNAFFQWFSNNLSRQIYFVFCRCNSYSLQGFRDSSLVQNKQWFIIWPPLTLFFWPILTIERSQIVQQKGNILNQNAENSHS